MGIRKRIVMILAVLLGLSLLPLVALLHPGLPITHDGQDHVARIANFYLSLSEGNLVPRWAGYLNWGYGHPILMFLYPLPSYMASFFIFLNFTFVDSTKLVFGVAYIASIFTMYLFAGTVWGKKVGFIAALLYGFAPYRFVDLYVRGAIGEHVAFIFPPLIFYFIYKLSHITIRYSPRASHTLFFIGLTLSMAALILSHNAISIMFLPIIIVYIVYLFFTEAQRSVVFLATCFLSLVFGFALSAFFWIPAFFEGKYTLRDIVTSGSMKDRFVPWHWFFISPWNYGGGGTFSKSVGLVQWFGILCAGIFLFVSKTKRVRIEIVGLFMLMIVSLFLMTTASSYIWQIVTILQKFQFPWRFLTIVVFATSLLAALGYVLCTRLQIFKNFILIEKHIDIVMLVFFILATTYGMWHPKGYVQKPQSYYTGVYAGTTDTGESSPIWSIRFMEHTYANPLEVIEGEVVIKEIARSTTKHIYEIKSSGVGRLVENTLFFPGWKVYIDGTQTGIQFQDPEYRGLMTFRVTEGTHTIIVKFSDTKLRLIANFISGVTIVMLLVIGLTGIILWKKQRK